MLGLGLSIPEIAIRGRRGFSPASLFANGEQGAWYDPADLTTLYSDSAGSTPVTAVEQPVGLMLDKSKGLIASTKGGQMTGVTGSWFTTPSAAANQVTGDIDIRVQASLVSWTPPAVTVFCSRILTGVNSGDSYEFQISNTGVLTLLTVSGTTNTSVTSSAAVGFAAGSTNWVRVTWQQSTGYVNFYTSSDGVTWTQQGTANRAGTTNATNAGTRALLVGARSDGAGSLPVNGKIYRAQIYSGINGTLAVDFNPTLYTSGSTFTAATGEVWTITGANARIVPDGNHAFNTNATTVRPTLSARVNQFERTEQFENAAWNKNSSSVTISADTAGTTDPLGGNTADKMVETATTTNHRLTYNATVSLLAGVTYKLSVYAKAAERQNIILLCVLGGNYVLQNFNVGDGTVQEAYVFGTALTAGTPEIAPVGTTGWYRCTFVINVVTGGSVTLGWDVNRNNTSGSSYLGDITKGIYIWGADLRVANESATIPYQRVTTSTDYDADPTKFPYYLRFDGVEDFLSFTPTFSTLGLNLFLGVRETGNAAANNRALFVGDATGDINNLGAILNGAAPANSSVGYRFPEIATVSLDMAQNGTVVVSYQRSSTTSQAARRNGVALTANTTTTTTFTPTTGRIGCSITSSANAVFFPGRIYQIIIRGALTDAATIASAETYVAAKSGVTL